MDLRQVRYLHQECIMAMWHIGTLQKIALPMLLLLSTGCAGLGSLDDLLSAAGGVYGGGSERTGEINEIDTRRQEIQLSSTWGRAERVRYDNRTEVVYGQRRYDVRDLARGDYIRMTVDQGRNGEVVARRIQVQQSARDRQGGVGGGTAAGRVQRIDGEVGRVDTQRGWFEIYDNRGGAVTVSMPYEPSRNDRDRFRRLRRGDRIRIEGEVLNASRVQLVRFL